MERLDQARIIRNEDHEYVIIVDYEQSLAGVTAIQRKGLDLGLVKDDGSQLLLRGKIDPGAKVSLMLVGGPESHSGKVPRPLEWR